MPTSPQVLDAPTVVLDRTPAATPDVDLLDLAVPLPHGPLVDAPIYDQVVAVLLCDPVIEAEHDADIRAAVLPLPPAAVTAQLVLAAA